MSDEQTKTQILPLDPKGHWRSAALACVSDGALVALPTETVYGLAGDATSARAVAAIYAAKGRPSHNPLIAHIASLEMAQRYGVFSAQALALARAFWPGPLTMVLPLMEGTNLAPAVTAGGSSVALRWPRGALGGLAQAFGKPLAAPSANLSGHVSPTSADHVAGDLGGRIAMIVDDGPCPIGLESTILDLRSDKPVLLRPGALRTGDIEAPLGQTISTLLQKESEKPIAPGMLASHYAPRARVRLNVLPGDVREGETYLGFGAAHRDGQPNLSLAGDLAQAAGQIYALLRAADEAETTAIAVAPIPHEGLGQALNDRLARAAAPRG